MEGWQNSTCLQSTRKYATICISVSVPHFPPSTFFQCKLRCMLDDMLTYSLRITPNSTAGAPSQQMVDNWGGGCASCAFFSIIQNLEIFAIFFKMKIWGKSHFCIPYFFLFFGVTHGSCSSPENCKLHTTHFGTSFASKVVA